MARARECYDCDALVEGRCEARAVCPHQEPEDVGMDARSIVIAGMPSGVIVLVVAAIIMGIETFARMWRG